MPRTAFATKARAGKDCKKGKQAKFLSDAEVANIVLEHAIHGHLEPLALANSRAQ